MLPSHVRLSVIVCQPTHVMTVGTDMCHASSVLSGGGVLLVGSVLPVPTAERL